MQPNEFFNNLFKARQDTHELHLKTRSYAQHMALGDFYDGITDLADELIETYQGEYGLVDLPKEIEKTNIDNPQDYIAAFVLSVKENRSIIGNSADTHLQNIIDEIVSLSYRTLYKLRYLG